jgi:hypothetical protein
LALAALVLLLSLPSFAGAQGPDTDGDGIEDDMEEALIDFYAPILFFHPEETYFPVSVQFAFDTGVLERYNGSGPPILIDASPNATVLAAFDVPADPEGNPGDVYYLNNTRGSRRDDSGILAAYEADPFPRSIYARVRPAGGETIIQY